MFGGPEEVVITEAQYPNSLFERESTMRRGSQGVDPQKSILPHCSPWDPTLSGPTIGARYEKIRYGRIFWSNPEEAAFSRFLRLSDTSRLIFARFRNHGYI